LVGGETAVNKDLLDLTDADTTSMVGLHKLLDPVEDVVDGRTPYGDRHGSVLGMPGRASAGSAVLSCLRRSSPGSSCA
jgi:hypothetical protein